jgi:tRNA pseudouridine(55) synthase
MIFALWQPRYASSHMLAQACAKMLGEKATHTGTLDPMAEGVLVILTGEDRYAKGLLSDWQKTYTFSILWGLATDSGDQLGMLTTVSTLQPEVEKLETVFADFPTHYTQLVPTFSARRFAGKSSFDFGKEKKVMSDKYRNISLTTLTLTECATISLNEVIEQQATAVQCVSGNFRQREIATDWQQLPKRISAAEQEFLITTATVTTSPGTYIRQLVQDLAKIVAVPALTWSITRTENGPFGMADCIAIDELSSFVSQ